jgi:hypothetical protein
MMERVQEIAMRPQVAITALGTLVQVRMPWRRETTYHRAARRCEGSKYQ